MGCVSPISGWLSVKLSENGKRPIVFDRSLGFADQPRVVPCGRCIGCKTSRASQWSTRATLELLSYPDGSSCFLTLTYDDEHLPGPSLVPEHLTLFWKRLRKAEGPLRYLACGEYGEQTNRPHFHAICFGFRPTDLQTYSSTLWHSPRLQSTWPYGQCLVGDASSASAAYVAGYISKKLEAAHYPAGILPPFLRVSSKPALGSRWIRDHWSDLEGDKVYVAPGVVAPVPKHILSLLEVEQPLLWSRIKALRRKRAALGEKTQSQLNNVEANLRARLKRRDFS